MTTDKSTSLVPKLRFPEFRDASVWSSSPLESVCDVLNNRRVPITTKDRKAGPFPYYGASGIVDNVDGFLFDERLILVGEDGAKWGPFEETAFIAEGKYWVNNHAHVLRSIDLVDSLLMAYLVRSDLGRYVTGAAPPKLTLGKLKTIPIPIPSSPAEQQKIADCLGSLDDLIAAEGRKLEALREHKHGLMQQLFPQPGETVPRLRFPDFQEAPEWSIVPLGSLFHKRQETGFSDLPLLSVTDRDGVIPQDTTNRKNTANSNIAKYLRVVPGDIAYNTMRMWEGRSARVGMEGVVSPAYTVCRPNVETNSYFFACYFKTKSLVKQFRTYSQGLVKDTLNLKYETFSLISVGYPPLNEQKKIADCLGSLDDLISTEGRKLEALRQHKRGLMQQVFPSLEEH